MVFFPVHPRKVLITNGLFCKVLRINDLGELLCFRPSGAWLPRGCLASTPCGPSASSGQAVGWVLPPLRGCGGFLICCQRAKCRIDCYFYFIVVCQGKNRSSQSPPTSLGTAQKLTEGPGTGSTFGKPVSESFLFPAFVALRSTYPANRPRMLSTSTLGGGLRDGPAFALRSVSRARRSSKLQLLMSPTLAPQQLRQIYRVSGSSPPLDRYFLRSPWFHFQSR